jgi:chromosome segregation ATPase
MATNTVLEQKINTLEAAFEEVQGAIRRLSQENNNALSSVNNLASLVTKLSVELAQMKVKLQEQGTKASVGRYE